MQDNQYIPMDVRQIYNIFPTKSNCINYLEQIKWGGSPLCPYCKSKNYTSVKKEGRYHCNSCNTSFGVTVDTLFHNTKLDLQKWFLMIVLVMNSEKNISARQLSKEIEVNKNTACFMVKRIQESIAEYREMLMEIAKVESL